MPEREYQDRSRAEQEGYDAYVRGEVICPYRGKTRKWKEWRRGWEDAEHILNIPIFPNNYGREIRHDTRRTG